MTRAGALIGALLVAGSTSTSMSGAAAAARDETVTAPLFAHAAARVSAPIADARERSVALREITIPAGVTLPLTLETSLASDQNRVEDVVRARTRRAIVIDGVTVLPAGSRLSGYVTSVERSGRVKGRARLAFRFNRLIAAGDEDTHTIRTSIVSRLAPGTKKKDAAKIALPAAGGAIIGGIASGKKGAAIGAGAGGGAGTAVVLATRGEEVRMGRGAAVNVRLLTPVRVDAPVR